VSLPAVPWQRLLAVENLQLQALRFYLHRIPYRTQLPIKIQSQIQSRSQNFFATDGLSFTATVDVFEPAPIRVLTIYTGKHSRHPATGCATLLQQLASFRDRYPATALHATVLRMLELGKTSKIDGPNGREFYGIVFCV
jgi:hypothetical protein